MAKKDIRICRYIQCKHEAKEINIITDEYVNKGSMYYHKDCYKAKVNGEWKDSKTKADLQLIKNLWVEHISETVVFTQLFYNLNQLIDRGISSDYLVFVLKYVIKHKMNLHYPAGLRYYVDRQEIKNAYKKHIAQNSIDKGYKFVAKDDDTAQNFTTKKKSKGFQNILRVGDKSEN